MNINSNWILPGVKCWLDVSKTNPEISYIPVEIISIDSSKKILIRTLQDKKTLETDCQNLLEKNEDIQASEGFEDLVQMGVLNEAEILSNLAIRFNQDIIFTCIGPTLLIINPYKMIPSLFSEDNMKIFRKKSDRPHIYSIAFLAYTQLIENSKNQAIVISGESGAGKTETTKHAMKFLTASTFSAKTNNEETPIEEKILRCNPILEAFGNAKTIRNDNSSRFGKFVRLLINKTSRSINGATITSYLLEKSRLTAPSKGERNFHIFYHLLEGCEPKELLSLNLLDPETKTSYKPEFFEYLRKSQCFSVSKMSDKELFYEVLASLNKTNFSQNEIKAIFRLLAAILHIGNLSFDSDKLTDNNPCTLKSGDLSSIAQMVSVPENALLQALVFKTREIQGQTINSPQPLSECNAIRDSLSKFLYEKLFNWLVKRLNLVIFPPEEVSSLRKVRKSIRLIRDSLTQIDCITSSIGLLDIFGFENFEINSFEQLCINYTNEKLQQLYVSYIFKAEERELVDQGLQGSLSQLAYQDNQSIIDLLDKYPSGVYDLLDESSSLGSSTDELLLQKIAKTHAKNGSFSMPKNRINSFIVIHTAKPVEYEIKGFRAKNKDEISTSLQMMLQASKDELLGQMIQTIFSKENIEKKKLGSVGISKSDKFLGAKFRNQMKDLMNELFNCEVHFIRCIKPNEAKKEGFFNADFVLLQIRYLGILDSIRIRKQGYALRKDYDEFSKKYSGVIGLLRKKNAKDTIRDYFEKNKQFSNEIGKKILFGKTKIYLKQEVLLILDEKMMEIWKTKIAVGRRIRKQFRVHLFRKKAKVGLKKVKKIIRAICKVQATVKAKQMRARFLLKKLATIKMSKKLKIILLSKNFYVLKTKINALVRLNNFLKAFKKLFVLKPLKSSLKHCFLLINSVKTKVKPQDSPPKKLTTSFSNGPSKQVETPKPLKSIQNPENSKPLPMTKKIVEEQKTPAPNTKKNEKSPEKIKKEIEAKKNDNYHEIIKEKKEEEANIKTAITGHFLKKSAFHKNDESYKTSNALTLKSESIDTNHKPNQIPNLNPPPTLHINLTDIKQPKIEREKVFNQKFVDPRCFEGNFIDLTPFLTQEIYSPLHHYTIYGSIEEPQSLSFSLIPISHDCLNDLKGLESNFMKFLTETNWEIAISKLLNPKTLKTHSFNEIMTHSKKKIKNSLQNLSSKLNISALLIFKYILQYCLEKKTKFPLLVQVKKLLKILFNSQDLELIDEFYLQIVKQINSCPNLFILKKLLTLLGMVSSVIAITPRMFMPFLSFLYSRILGESLDEEALYHARFCFLRVKGLFECGSRQAFPLDNELFLVENRKKIMVTIHFLLGNHIFIYVESYTTIKEAVSLALFKLGLESKIQYFGLYQVKRSEDPLKYEEKFLDDSVRILDVLTLWELEQKHNSSEMKLYIRQRMFFKFQFDDLDSIETLYEHFVYEVLRGRLDFDESIALKLGALSLAVDHGDFSKEKARFLKINIQRYIPENFLALNPPQVWIDRILMNYLKIKCYDRTKAKLEYLDHIKNHRLFFSEQFKIEYTIVNLELKGNQIEKKEKQMLLAIKPDGLYFYHLDPIVTECLKKYLMTDIKSWGVNEGFMILVETEDGVKHLIKSSRCLEIEYLIKKYIDFDNIN